MGDLMKHFLKSKMNGMQGMMFGGIVVIITLIIGLQILNYNKLNQSKYIVEQIQNSLKLEKESIKPFISHYTETVNLMTFTSLFIVALLFSVYLVVNRLLVLNLKKINEGFQKSTLEISSTVDSLKTEGGKLSSAVTSSAASLEETVASVEELSSMVQLNTDNAKQAATLSYTSRDSAEKGESEIKTLIESIGAISESSHKIEEIITVIDDIAFQTNLLALNAAVEAARAGEQGRGFAVVAEAVRSLAQRSASAAKDITGLIKESVHLVERSKEIADQSGNVLISIVTSAKKVSDLNDEISSASTEQANGIIQISSAMNQIDHASQANAATAEKIFQISNDLSLQIQNFKVQLADFNANFAGEISPEKTNPKKEKTIKSNKKDFKKELSGFKNNQNVVKVDFKKESTVTQNTTKKFEKFSEPKPTVEHSKKVHEKTAAEELIPFDDDETRGKIGTTDSF